MDLNFNKNEDHNKLLLSDLRHRFAKIKLGGGEKRIKKLHSEGKMTARERIDYLLDKGKHIEIGGFVGEGMYEAYGGCPSGGVVVKIGYIKGRQCIVVANDATVKAGCISGAPGTGMMINSSRAILYASSGTDFAEAARAVAQSTRDALRTAAAK